MTYIKCKTSLILRFPSPDVSPSSSGAAVAVSARPPWSQSAGLTPRPTWTPASWSRRTAGPGAWAASPRSTTGPAARSGGRRRGTTSINSGDPGKYYPFLEKMMLLTVEGLKIRTKRMITTLFILTPNIIYIYVRSHFYPPQIEVMLHRSVLDIQNSTFPVKAAMIFKICFSPSMKVNYMKLT